MSRKRRRADAIVPYLPSPDEIRLRALAIRQAKGAEFPNETFLVDDEDRWAWRQARRDLRQMLREMTPAQRTELGRAERAESLRFAAEDRRRRQAELIRDMARGTPQREADANDGTEPKPGRHRPHYKSWETRKLCRRMLAAGKSPADIMKHFHISPDERKVRDWLLRLKRRNPPTKRRTLRT